MRFLPFALALLACSATALAQTPKVNDERLKIELVTEAPDIATPIGIDIDDKGRIYVIESHTHFPQQSYPGPKTDRIRVYEDLNGDRKADRITNFHIGETHTMSLALYRDGSLYVATRREVFRLRDTNKDGVADERTSLVKLETKGNYPHNGLNGFAFDFKGDVYFGFGENLGESYKLIGSDSTTLEGGGEGGNIYTCDKDGKKLRRVATGFWNPFHLCFDTFGRLFAVDNDPDGRPPCRLLHIVEGGDYGYRFRYGRGGQHPFTSWNGEIPGTLPMVSGTGEAPSGMIAYESDNLPDDYLGNLLVTSWGDHRIERYRLKQSGASFTSKMEPVVTGGDNFRPVGIALAPDGSLYISDWVDKSYNVHGKGRIWRLSAKEEKKVERPDPVKRPELSIHSKHRPLREAAAFELLRLNAFGEIRKVVSDPAADLQSRAVGAMALQKAGQFDESLAEDLFDSPQIELTTIAAQTIWRTAVSRALKKKRVELEAIELATLSAGEPVDTTWGFAAGAEDAFVSAVARTKAIKAPWFKEQFASEAIDEKRLTSKLPSGASEMISGLILAQRASAIPECRTFIPSYLNAADDGIRFLAIQWIAEEKLSQYRQQLTDSLSRPDTTPRLLVATLTALDMLDGGKPGSVDHVGGRWYLERLVFGEKTAPATRAMAMRMLPPNNPALTVETLKKLLATEDEKLRVEVVRTLRQSPHKERSSLLRDVVKDEKQPAEVRAEAIEGLEQQDEESLKLLVSIAHEDTPLRDDALRALRGAPVNSVVTTIDLTGRPKDDDTAAWLKWLDGAKPQAADAAHGQRVFFSAKGGGCFRCHTVGGRGGVAGPDLSTIGKTLSRERLLESILQPSKEIAPRFAAQLVETSDGEKRTLMYVGPAPDGTQVWADTNGKEHKIAPGEVESKQPLETSIMPSGLHQAMTPRELRDLLAFLESLK